MIHIVWCILWHVFFLLLGMSVVGPLEKNNNNKCTRLRNRTSLTKNLYLHSILPKQNQWLRDKSKPTGRYLQYQSANDPHLPLMSHLSPVSLLLLMSHLSLISLPSLLSHLSPISLLSLMQKCVCVHGNINSMRTTVTDICDTGLPRLYLNWQVILTSPSPKS